MFLNKRTCLNVVLVNIFLSSQLYAADISREYAFLPKVASPSQAMPAVSRENQSEAAAYQYQQFKLSVVDVELDQMEKALEESKEAVPSVKQELVKPASSSTVQDKKSASSTDIASSAVQLPVASRPRKKDLPAQSKKSEVVSNNDKAVIKNVLIDEIIKSSTSRPGIRMEFDSSVKLEGKNIQRFLVMDNGFLDVQKTDSDHLLVKAVKYGGTFLNVWDDSGRRTIYVGVVFPQSDDLKTSANSNQTEHERPFRFTYSNDWNTYYVGVKNEEFKRQSYSFLSNYALEGQTPYGHFDSDLTTDEFNGRPSITYRTIGLTGMAVPGQGTLNLRVFDASRYLSPLTMSSTRLDGYFADLDIRSLHLGSSYSYGKKKPFFSPISSVGGSDQETFIHAYRLIVNPVDVDNQLAFNLAKSSGYQQEDVTKKVYSVEARKKLFNTFLNAEYGSDTKHTSSLVGAKWREGALSSMLNFRQINKSYTNITGFPSNQGEIGGTWTTSYDVQKLNVQAVLNMYRQYLFFNPNNPDALNFDTSAAVFMPITDSIRSDSSAYYVTTPGESSPRSNLALNQRFTKSFNFFTLKSLSVYLGGVFQRTRYEFSPSSEYDRWAVTTGIQVPLTPGLSVYANFDHSWVHEIESREDFTPHTLDTGFYYNKELTNKLTGNFSLFYRKEMGAGGTSSYLSGEDSAGASLGLSYNLMQDANMFFDARSRKIWPQLENGGFTNYDMDIRFGFRMAFDVLSRGWDPSARVQGHVFKDKDAEGLYNKNYAGLEGVKVKIGEREVTTDKNGFYQMNVRAKRVSVTPVSDSLPSGVIFTTPIVRSVDIKQGASSTVDFGLNSQTGIYGLVFVDKNGNGIPEPTDDYVKNIKVLLDKKYKSVSDGQGAFYFRNIPEGVHTIKIDINSVPINMIPQVKLESKITVAEGTTYLFHIPMKTKIEK